MPAPCALSCADWSACREGTGHSYPHADRRTVTAGAGQTVKKMVGGKEYCITTESEGAAGSIFLQYTYTFGFDSKTAVATFSLREVQCGNYDDPQKTECETERKSFNVDTVLAQMLKTVRVE